MILISTILGLEVAWISHRVNFNDIGEILLMWGVLI